MTTDILLDVSQKDFLYDESSASQTFFTAEYGAHQIGEDTNSYLDVVVPNGYTITPASQDVFIKAPYIPVLTPITVRFLKQSGTSYSIIKVFGQDSLQLYFYNQNGEKESLYGCKLMAMNIDGLVRLHCVSAQDGCEVFLATNGDFQLGNADKNSVDMMMECAPGKNYRYPMNGVGVARFLGSIIDRTPAAPDILRELGDDKQSVREVYYDQDTQKMRVITDEYNNKQKIDPVDTSTLDVSEFEEDE